MTPPADLENSRPVRAELKFHGDASDDPDGKVDAEDARPEFRRAIVAFVVGAQKFGLEIDDEQGEAHGQLRENVMERYREGKMQPMNV